MTCLGGVTLRWRINLLFETVVHSVTFGSTKCNDVVERVFLINSVLNYLFTERTGHSMAVDGMYIHMLCFYVYKFFIQE